MGCIHHGAAARIAAVLVFALLASGCSSAVVDASSSAGDGAAVVDEPNVDVAETDDEIGDEPAETAAPAVSTASVRVSDGLISYYGFEEGSGDQVTDAAGGFDLTIADPSAAEWTDGALRINSPTTISNPAPPTSVIEAATASGELSVEAWIETGNLDQSGPARIVSISGDTQNRNFTVGQGVHNSDGNFLDFRLRSSDTSDNGEPSLASPDDVFTTALTHIVATRSPNGTTRLYFDGALQSTGSAGGDLANWDDDYRLLLGNETTGDRPWVGTLYLVAIYDRALTEAEVTQNFSAGHLE